MNNQWKLVPVEPTETMVINGFESEPDECFTDEEVWEQYQEMSGCQQAAFRAKLCWAAMVAAAPTPAPETVKSGGEPKPYPDRLCHIDYTAHPYRCGCLSGDDEAQRRFDEYQRDTKLATAEGEVARLTAERDALQLRLNAADQLNDELGASLKELISAVRSINRSPAYKVTVIGDDEPQYRQRKEWIDWVLELCDKAAAGIEQPAPVAVVPPQDEKLMEIVERYPNGDPLEYDAALRQIKQ